ncbi:MAG: TIGR02301 family protein [Bauldia sp.]
MIARICALLMLACLVGAGGALGQETAPVPAVPTEPAYDPQLLRLSEILGSVHYLRRLCDAKEGNLWRDQMQALIDAENPDVERRARLVDRFNRGYQGFRSVYRTCTPAATVAIDRYMNEGAKIARDITARYGKS